MRKNMKYRCPHEFMHKAAGLLCKMPGDIAWRPCQDECRKRGEEVERLKAKVKRLEEEIRNYFIEKGQIKEFLAGEKHEMGPGEPLLEKVKNLCTIIESQRELLHHGDTEVTQ